jgi:putative transposon-encoded protein
MKIMIILFVDVVKRVSQLGNSAKINIYAKIPCTTIKKNVA